MATTKNKNKIGGTDVKIISIAFLFLLSMFLGGKANAAANNANIQVCVQPPMPNMTDPTTPKISFTTSGNPFSNYQVAISRDSIFTTVLYDTGIQKWGSGNNPPGTYTLTVPKGILPIDDTTYNFVVRVKDAYDWTPYAQGNFVLKGTSATCPISMSDENSSGARQVASGACGSLVNVFGAFSFSGNAVQSRI